MSLRRVEGFDGLNSYAEILSLRGGIETLASGTGMNYQPTGGRNGNAAIRHSVTGAVSRRSLEFSSTAGAADLAAFECVIGMAIKIKRGTFNPVVATTPHPLFQLKTTAGAEVASVSLIKSGTDWRIAYYTGITLRAISTTFPPGLVADHRYPTDDTWFYLEVKVSDFTTTATSAVTVKVNGVTIIATASNIVTTSASTFFQRVEINAGMGTSTNQSTALVSGQEIFYDDFYWLSLTLGEHTDFLGDCRVDYVPAATEGFHTDSTPDAGADRAAMVDDVPSDGDTTFNVFAGVTSRDTFVLAPLAVTPLAVIAVTPHFTIRDAGDVPRFLNICSRWASTDYDQNAAVTYIASPGASYRGFWLGEPNANIHSKPGGGRWTEADLATAEFGLFVQS